MIASSHMLKGVALIVAVAAHAAFGVSVMRPGEAPTLIEGASGAAEVRLGNSFRDLTQGTLEQVAPDQPLDRVAPEPAMKPLEPVPAAKPVPIETVKPLETPPPKPVRATPRRVVKADPEPKPKPTPPVQKAARQGAQKEERTGTATGKARAQAASKGAEGRQQSAGNAKSSNYRGLVMRKLSRARRPKATRGRVARVSFTISTSGGLSRVAVAQGSGSAAYDRKAVQLVKRAAPFPKPPAGVTRDFVVAIKSQ